MLDALSEAGLGSGSVSLCSQQQPEVGVHRGRGGVQPQSLLVRGLRARSVAPKLEAKQRGKSSVKWNG